MGTVTTGLILSISAGNVLLGQDLSRPRFPSSGAAPLWEYFNRRSNHEEADASVDVLSIVPLILLP